MMGAIVVPDEPSAEFELPFHKIPVVGTLPLMPKINQEVIPADLDRFPSIVAVVDRDGDVWVRDGDVWSYASPADFSTECLSADALEIAYGVLRVAWVWL